MLLIVFTNIYKPTVGAQLYFSVYNSFIGLPYIKVTVCSTNKFKQMLYFAQNSGQCTVTVTIEMFTM